LLAGLPLDLSLASREPVARLHEQLWKRFTDGGADGGTATSPAAGPPSLTACADEGDLPAALGDKRSKETAALALLAAHPEKTVKQVADEIRCNRSSLYRNPLMKVIRKEREERKQGRRRGRRVRDRAGDTYVDGIDETDPTDIPD
jgi:hypothetical protein